MRTILICLMLLSFLGLLGLCVEAQAPPVFLIVGNSASECPGAAFERIQDAIDQAPIGANIEVCPGVYPEALVITKPLSLLLEPRVVLRPENLSTNAYSLVTGDPFAAVVLVKGTEDVSLWFVTVDGGAANITQCTPNLIGILFQNASGRILNSEIRNIKLPDALAGCQSGNGILVQSGDGGRSDVAILHNRVESYQKNGITANEAGTSARIYGNTVVGSGPTSGAAQNGIQVGFGAKGEILKNSVLQNIWSPCSSPDDCVSFATGILIEQSTGVLVADNDSIHNQVNIFDSGDKCKIFGNHSAGAVVLDGIEVFGNGCKVEENRVFDSNSVGIFIAGNEAFVEHNEIVEANIGILKLSSSVGTIIGPNDFNSVTTAVMDPRALPPRHSSPIR